MHPTLHRKLESLAERRDELERLLADPGVAGDAAKFRALSREFAQLEPVSAALADEVRRWVIDGPAQHGLDRANWTHEELADHLRKTRGLQTSRSAVQRFCTKIGIRLYRPTYRYERGDPVKQAQAKEDLADLGKGRRPVNSSS